MIAAMIAPALLLYLVLPQGPTQTEAATDPVSLAMTTLRAMDLEAWQKTIEPAAADLSFLEIPWLPTFAEGVLAADAQGVPLLFWAMNGHPLACT